MPQNYVLSVVIPCYNEKDNIIKIVDRVRKAPVENMEIIIVDDMLCSHFFKLNLDTLFFV